MKNIKSKFSFFPILLCLLLTFIVIMVFFLSYNSPAATLYLPIFGILFVSFFWLTEFRTKAHKIYITPKTIAVRQFFGLGKRKEYEFSDIKGFITTKQTGGAGKYEYLFIINENKRLISASTFYHRNYEELKKEIEDKFTYLGEKKFGFTEEYTEMLK